MAVKGFVYRFMYVRVREKMAGKVICHPHSVFGRLATKILSLYVEIFVRQQQQQGALFS